MVTKEEQNLISKIEEAIQSTIIDEKDLLMSGKIERTFTSYLAVHIFDNLNIENIRSDPFCNKHYNHETKAKYLGGGIIGLDIAVHKRNTDENNLVAIEIETNNNPTRDDVWKIKELTNSTNDYNYKLGLYIAFGVFDKAGKIITKEWYKNGELIEKIVYIKRKIYISHLRYIMRKILLKSSRGVLFKNFDNKSKIVYGLVG